MSENVDRCRSCDEVLERGDVGRCGAITEEGAPPADKLRRQMSSKSADELQVEKSEYPEIRPRLQSR